MKKIIAVILACLMPYIVLAEMFEESDLVSESTGTLEVTKIDFSRNLLWSKKKQVYVLGIDYSLKYSDSDGSTYTVDPGSDFGIEMYCFANSSIIDSTGAYARAYDKKTMLYTTNPKTVTLKNGDTIKGKMYFSLPKSLVKQFQDNKDNRLLGELSCEQRLIDKLSNVILHPVRPTGSHVEIGLGDVWQGYRLSLLRKKWVVTGWVSGV